jgi:hypothetical protein
VNTIPPRYNGKPLLRLLELYVLHHIGQLTKEHQDYLKAKTPELRKAYNRSGEWHEIIASVMKFPKGFHEHMLEKWRLTGSSLSAERFAQEFIDANVQHDP